MRDLYTENCKALMKEIKDSKKWNGIPIHGLEKLILLKWTYHTKPSYRLMQSLSTFQWLFPQK